MSRYTLITNFISYTFMLFSAVEISVLNNALILSGKKDHTGNIISRTFPIGKLKDASEVGKLITEAVNEDKTKFIETDLEFTTEQKALILECLNDREWGAMDGGIVLALKEKLS